MRFLTPHRLWIAIFAGWLLILSGTLKFWSGSPPGALQALRLQSLKKEKTQQLAELERSIERMQAEATRLTQNPIAQEREVRRVLGYAASDELLFDFSSAARVGEALETEEAPPRPTARQTSDARPRRR